MLPLLNYGREERQRSYRTLHNQAAECIFMAGYLSSIDGGSQIGYGGCGGSLRMHRGTCFGWWRHGFGRNSYSFGHWKSLKGHGRLGWLNRVWHYGLDPQNVSWRPLGSFLRPFWVSVDGTTPVSRFINATRFRGCAFTAFLVLRGCLNLTGYHSWSFYFF